LIDSAIEFRVDIDDTTTQPAPDRADQINRMSR
jgi:hypothetical protein